MAAVRYPRVKAGIVAATVAAVVLGAAAMRNPGATAEASDAPATVAPAGTGAAVVPGAGAATSGGSGTLPGGSNIPASSITTAPSQSTIKPTPVPARPRRSRGS